MDNFYKAHKANHSEKYCPTFINMFELFITGQETSSGAADVQATEAQEPPPEESTINHFWDLSDIFEEEYEEGLGDVNITQHSYQTRSKGPPTPTGGFSPSILVVGKPDLPKKSVPSKLAIAEPVVDKATKPIDKTSPRNLDFSIVDELKNTRASISLFEITEIAQFIDEIVNTLLEKAPNLPKDLISNLDILKPQIEGSMIRQKSKSQTPPILLTFEIYNHNVQNCMVD